MPVYYPGSLVKLSVSFYDSSGSAADPDVVTLTVLTPTRVSTTYTYSPGDIVRDDVGQYHYGLNLTMPSTDTYDWEYEWVGTGNVTAVKTGSVAVAPFPTSGRNPIQDQIDTLTAAISTGTLEVRFQDRMVRYQSIESMIKARALLYLQLNGAKTTRQVRVWTEKGL